MSTDAASTTPAASEAPATASSPAPAADNTPAPAAAAAADNKDEAKPASSESNAAPASQNQGSSSSNTGPSPSTSLYIGELDPTVTEAMLYEIFSMIGPVASIRVCRDAVTRRSLGYAYVNYLNSADGERALEQLNYSSIKGRPCRIMWSQRDPSLRKNGAGNIFIKNLDENIDNKALHDTFAAFGNILSCKVAVDGQGNSLGYGFVHYDTPEAARAAIEGVNGMLLNDKVVYVGIHIPKRERQAKIDEIRAHFTNLYIKNVPLEVDEAEFRGLFEPFGKVTSAVITKDAEGNSKGFGFVNYERHEDAAKAVDALHDKDYKGQNLYVARAQRKSEREEELKKSYEQKKYEANLKYQGVNLYVKNLDDDIDEEKLRAEFEPYGQITSCKIMSDDKGASKGFGFVCFSAPDEATKALTELNGKMLGTKPLYVALAQRKDVRKQQLEAQVAQRQQIRAQQMQAAGIPGIPPYMPGAPMYYGPAGYPQPGARGPMGYPQPASRDAGWRPPPRGGPVPNGAPIPPRGAPVPPNGVPRPAAQAGQPPQRRPRAEEQKAQGGLTAAMLANAAPQEQKQMLGEALYPRIHASQPELAGKVTGMLLEMDSSELLYLLENDEALAAKVQEALDVLAEYNQRQTGDEASGEEAPAAAPAAEATEEASA
uniref:Polyadenylate-binding protein n=1 Tax=Rhodotorula toruloides TaxID=5286 RepID=A0A0K3CFG2_RHOTO